MLSYNNYSFNLLLSNHRTNKKKIKKDDDDEKIKWFSYTQWYICLSVGCVLNIPFNSWSKYYSKIQPTTSNIS